jgi:N-methylhydantoinase A
MVFDAALGVSVDAWVMHRDDLKTGQVLSGPAVVTEDETTIIIPQSRQAMRQIDGCIDITVQS